MKEIHRSKTTYCSFKKAEYADYDLILDDITKINKKNILAARRARAERLSKLAHEEAQSKAKEKLKLDDFQIKYTKIPATDVVFRIMTWEHIPLDDVKTLKARKSAKEQFEDDENNVHVEYDEEDPKHNKYVKVNFPPFQHYKVDDENQPYVVGKSHWKGGIVTGSFSKEHGSMTPKLAHMFMKLCERYATRSNWRGYCVDEQTQALTQRGWLGYNEINESDQILSYNGNQMTWSKIHSIFRSEYDGLMHALSSPNFNSLVTPNHKILTDRGLVPVDLLELDDTMILMGHPIRDTEGPSHSSSYLHLLAWIFSAGSYEFDSKNEIKKITISQKSQAKVNDIRNILTNINCKFNEQVAKGVTSFELLEQTSRSIFSRLPNKKLDIDFVLSLHHQGRYCFLESLIQNSGQYLNHGYAKIFCRDQYEKDLVMTMAALSGLRTSSQKQQSKSSYSVSILPTRKNTTKLNQVSFHGGKSKGTKLLNPNKPTMAYKGWVWCPETDFGCFLARRYGSVFLTGNTYNDEMRSQALLQLSQIGLQFDENKSQNPFAYYTAAITNSFTRVLNIEKRNQNLRDDILEINGLTPSYTRQGITANHKFDDQD